MVSTVEDILDAVKRATEGYNPDLFALPDPLHPEEPADPMHDFWDNSDSFWYDDRPNVTPQQSSAEAKVAQAITSNPQTAKQFAVAEQTGEPGARGTFTGAAHWMDTHKNGQIPLDALVKVQNEYLRPDVAKAARAMIRAAKKDGVDISIVSGYRSYDEQASLYAQLHGTAPVAEAGKSNHGWGTAMDTNYSEPGVGQWLEKNAGRFGFANDVAGDANHFDYTGGYDAAYTKTRTPSTRTRKTQDASMPTLSELFGPMSIGPIDPFATMGTQVAAVAFSLRDKPAKSHEAHGVPSWVPAKQRDWFAAAARASGLSARLIAAVAWIESRFQTGETSSAGAEGEMQLEPYNSVGIDPFNARQNIIRGAQYLAGLLSHVNGDTRLALAHYNGGNSPPPESFGYADDVLNIFRNGI